MALTRKHSQQSESSWIALNVFSVLHLVTLKHLCKENKGDPPTPHYTDVSIETKKKKKNNDELTGPNHKDDNTVNGEAGLESSFSDS